MEKNVHAGVCFEMHYDEKIQGVLRSLCSTSGIVSKEGSSSDEATELHFQILRSRYGDPLIILNLTKVDEEHPGSLLHNAFNNVVRVTECINKDMDTENQLTLWNLDLNTDFLKVLMCVQN